MMIHKTIRVHRRDSAFIYAILESLEGMASFSTLPDEPGQTHRDIALFIPPSCERDINIILDGMRKKFPILEIAAEETT
jgi:hypothetical protein